jgi:hypothetical protein
MSLSNCVFSFFVAANRDLNKKVFVGSAYDRAHFRSCVRKLVEIACTLHVRIIHATLLLIFKTSFLGSHLP